MTANEMRNLAKELYDGSSPMEMGYDDKEVSRFLNVAKTLEVDKRLFGDNQAGTGLEVGSKRDTELSELKTIFSVHRNYDETYTRRIDNDVDVTPYEVVADMVDNAFTIELPEDFMYYTRDFADIKIGDIVNKVVIESVNEDNISEELTNVFMKPSRGKILRTSIGVNRKNDSVLRRVKLFIPIDSILYKYVLVYIRKPVEIVVNILVPDDAIDSDLDETMHIPIVKTAVQLMLGSIGSQKYQVAVNENSNNF